MCWLNETNGVIWWSMDFLQGIIGISASDLVGSSSQYGNSLASYQAAGNAQSQYGNYNAQGNSYAHLSALNDSHRQSCRPGPYAVSDPAPVLRFRGSRYDDGPGRRFASR